MSQQNQQTNISSPSELPAKRKRGRPRKDGSQIHGEKFLPNPPTKPTTSINVHGGKPAVIMRTDGLVEVDRRDQGDDSDNDDQMVGKLVTGVLESAFDAGYFLNVKVQDTDTYMRGVVFQEGKFIPVTSENDIAPNVMMYRRKEIPIPKLNLLIKKSEGSASKSTQNDEQAAQLEKLASVVAPSSVELPENSKDGSTKDGIDQGKNTASEVGIESGEKKIENPSEGLKESEALTRKDDLTADVGLVAAGLIANHGILIAKEGNGTDAEEEKDQMPESESVASIQPILKDQNALTELSLNCERSSTLNP
ncbi:hypothetical protein Nepgr_007159 [Nepenthes gracilis]|uniref:Uncharacterized protein n=1 Tax=Nepenthes gracilis TaxID=150966 RepID=A0AAD3S6N6_NEPGR|nr:hypothetical protein Nepgr_007159 [Nepenthes gracilis]